MEGVGGSTWALLAHAYAGTAQGLLKAAILVLRSTHQCWCNVFVLLLLLLLLLFDKFAAKHNCPPFCSDTLSNSAQGG